MHIGDLVAHCSIMGGGGGGGSVQLNTASMFVIKNFIIGMLDLIDIVAVNKGVRISEGSIKCAY